MGKCKKIILVFLVFGISFYGMTGESSPYRVVHGEALSLIISRLFPNDRIYGRHGKLAEVIMLNNGKIKDKDLIFPDQTIILPLPSIENNPTVKIENLPLENKERESDVTYRTSGSTPWSMDTSAHYGMKTLNFKQKGALGTGSLDATFYNYFKVSSEVVWEKWRSDLSFETFKIHYSTQAFSIQETMYDLRFGMAREWIMASVGIEESPVLSDRTGRFKLTKQGIGYIGLGGRKEFHPFLVRLLLIELKSEVRIPVKNFDLDSDTNASSLSGYHLFAEANLKTELLKREKCRLFLTWVNDIGYQKLSQNMSRGSSRGKVKSEATIGSSALGLSFIF